MVFASVDHSDICVSGDVRIDPSAVIAPGVVIQAVGDSYVAIAAGVCLGMGAIIQAHQGNIEICQGAMVGAKVLIIGHSTIGANACIGYGSTIFYTSVPATTVTPPNSLLGDTSRHPTPTNDKPDKKNIPKIKPDSVTPAQHINAHKNNLDQNDTATPVTDPWGEEPSPPTPEPTETEHPSEDQNIPPIPEPINEHTTGGEDPSQEVQTEEKTVILDPPEDSEKEEENKDKPPVVGKVYINQLLMTLFPHNHQIHAPKNN